MILGGAASRDVRVLAVDDIYLRNGDEETHRVLIIVRDTTKVAVQPVVESFPSAALLRIFKSPVRG